MALPPAPAHVTARATAQASAPATLARQACAAPVVARQAGFSWSSLALRGLRVMLCCALVAVVLAYLRGASLPVVLAYSGSIGLLSWLAIDLGRHVLRPDPRTGWPPGWRGVALCVLGCALGYGGGTALGDALNGLPIWQSHAGTRRMLSDMALSGLIGALFSGYHYLRGKNAYVRAQAAQSERDLALARLAMLQTQLEPHMLFNTLANLRVLIALDAGQAQAMLDRLIAYLRATLGASRQTLHPLASEFDRLADYLALMAVRMGARLQVATDLPDALRQRPVPPLLLQPLVENAIQHGLEPQIDGGTITLRARADGGMLCLTVQDSGAGLRSAGGLVTAPPGPPTDSRGYGTRHVAERLATLYGSAGTLRLEPAAGGGTVAEVRLPLPPPAPGLP